MRLPLRRITGIDNGAEIAPEEIVEEIASTRTTVR